MQEFAAAQAVRVKHIEPKVTQAEPQDSNAQRETAVKQVGSVSSMSKLQVSKPPCPVNISVRDAVATVHAYHMLSHEVFKN